MNSFDNVCFSGTFRDYQQKVLDNSSKYLKDGHIHIVAAPGSGKTILGLELIRRLKSPALILSPSVTIRQQWGERFAGSFLKGGENIDDYISFDIKHPSLITSITYQALHAAYNKTSVEAVDSEDDEENEKESEADFSSFELIRTVKAFGIKTICLDEAHHLRSEWQKALEGFVSAVSSDVTIIALTATPPYDSTPNEWKRYSDLCGEIDEEIFVPQLVAQKTLCPHQDFIYFNYPSDEERTVLAEQRIKAETVAKKIINDGMLSQAVKASNLFISYEQDLDFIYANDRQMLALLAAAKGGGMLPPQRLIKLLSPKGQLPQLNVPCAEAAFQFILDNPEKFGEENTEKIRAELSQNGLIEKRKAALTENTKTAKLLVSSIGKLNSIKEIVKSELSGLGGNLRMLILTDFIKKDMLKLIGTQEPIVSLGTVPIFETVRRAVGSETNIAVLSGGLVIVADRVVEQIEGIAEKRNISCIKKSLAGSGYCELSLSGSNKNRVSVITEAFGMGLINILIGTKSLLGEGWDSPCINSLILASFVGSFMLSNQMRGRAIRMDKDNPQKVSSIWHLVTLDVPQNQSEQGRAQYTNQETELFGNDYDSVARRFECFLAPAYSSNIITNGISRLDIIKPPYNKNGIESINSQMLALSKDKLKIAKSWHASIDSASHPEVTEVAEVSGSVKPKAFVTSRLIYAIIMLMIAIVFVVLGFVFISNVHLIGILSFAVSAVMLIVSASRLSKALRFINPQKTVQTLANAVFTALKKAGEIQSKGAKVTVKQRKKKNTSRVFCALQNATEHEKNVFSNALSEIFSAIDNPRYVLVKLRGNGSYDYKHSYACPTVISTNKSSAEFLAQSIKKSSLGRFAAVYTRSEDGRSVLLNCRRSSYMNLNENKVKTAKFAGENWE